jgi:hypothetical protein
MTKALTRDEILARKVAGRTEQVPLGDGHVTVRGLTRKEAARMQAAGDDVIRSEAIALSIAVVTPKLTEAEALEWLEQDGSEAIQPVITAIQRLSGSAPGQAKEYTKSVS